MLARVAENLYWMARYLERAENTARLIDSTTNVLLDLPHGASVGWANLAEIAGVNELFAQHHDDANELNIMEFMIADTRNPSAIFSCVQQARENTRTLREVVPAEMWERINNLYLFVRDRATGASNRRHERYQMLNSVMQQCHSIVGLFVGTMAQDDAYQMVRLGRNLERADMTTRLLDLNYAVHLPEDSVLREALMERIWKSTLDALSAYQTYRRLVSMHVRRNQAARFLMMDRRFPRSVMHCIGEIEACFQKLPKSQQLQQITAQMHHKLAYYPTEHLNALALHEYLDVLQTDLGSIHQALTQKYFHAWQEDSAPSALPPADENAIAQQ